MRVSLKWLKELVDIDLPVAEFARRLDMTGTVVDAIESTGATLDGVVVGQILTKEHHPDADTLWLTTVDIGGERPLDIVCGAQNFEAGDKVPVATVGTTLPNGMTIKKAKIRGCVSEGMNASPDELGLGGEHLGLLILPEDAPIGEPFAAYWGMSDTVLDLEVTPNRPDCLSMVGVAREVAAVTGKTSRRPEFQLVEAGAAAADQVSVSIVDPELCPRYTARLIKGVKIGASPEWLVERVLAAGARPINNVVDITNYVMFELGQPLHAFDADTLARDEGKIAITVRLAEPAEDLVTLDGQDRQLAQDTLVIADLSGAVALAGVMGGESTEVSEATVNVLLESASFDSSSTSRTSRRLGLISEASQRFERGVDPNGCVEACDRAAALIAEVAGGQVAAGIVDTYPRAIEPLQVELRTARVNEVLGTSLAPADARAILERLGLTVEDVAEGRQRVTVPTFRPDIEREIDLIEEIVRVFGMENVESTLPAGRGRIGGLTAAQRRRAGIGELLRAAGLSEAITWSFGDPRDMARLGWELGPGEVPVTLLNPMVEDQSVMRWTTVPGMLRAVANNQRKGVPDVHLYEVGAVWWTAPGRKQPKQRDVVSMALAGRWESPSWWEGAEDRERGLDFFDGKGVLTTLLEGLRVERWKLREGERAWLQPGRSADVIVGGDVIGWLGEIHPRVLDVFEADGPVTMFEVLLPPLLKAARDSGDFSDLPRFPAVKADIALVVDEAVTAERVEQAIRSAGGKMLESVRLFDVYRGKGVPEGRKSLAFSLTYRDPQRTLTDEEVAAAHEKLVRKVSGAVGGELRGS
jgi:phenylalanyl-tRNA synthetase beta chain